MTAFPGQRRWIVPAFLLAVAAVSAGVWRYGYLQALDQLARRGDADLALASDRLSTQLQVYRELAVLMADHPALEGLDDPARARAAQALLLRVADKTAALDVVYARADGRVLAAARGITGPDLRGTPAFERALHGALGSEHGLLGATGLRAYTYAAPVFGAGGAVRGALVVVADIEDVEQTWRGSAPVVFFTDTGGEVFMLNMGEQVKIIELAETMIRLMGYEPHTEIPIHFTGPRPGERLQEVLFAPGEPMLDLGVEGILGAKPDFVTLDEMRGVLDELTAAVEEDDQERIHTILQRCVKDFTVTTA